MFSRGLQTLLDKIHVLFRHLDARGRLLLKGVQDIDHTVKLDRVNSAVGIRLVAVSNLLHRGGAKAFEGLYGRIVFAPLRGVKGLSDVPSHRCWEGF